MAKCCFGFDLCNRIATTTLKRGNGEIVQLCEEHSQFMIDFAKGVASGEIDFDLDDPQATANHWLVKNKIPS